jgi:hypothetical protein
MTLSGPTMFARIGVMRALNRHAERVLNPSRKDTHLNSPKIRPVWSGIDMRQVRERGF